MKKEELLYRVAPCSMLCYTCLALRDGAFSECAPRLDKYCEGVCEFLAKVCGLSGEELERHNAFFEEFHGSLKQLSGGHCHGCRSDASLKQGCLGGCIIPDCVKQHGVDFCAECTEFPCQAAKDFFSAHKNSGRIWEEGSGRIREIGAEAYYEEKKDTSHYIHHKKQQE